MPNWTHKVEWLDGDTWRLNSCHKSKAAAEREAGRGKKLGFQTRAVAS